MSAAPQHEWHIISCEFPPKIGGVADYTNAVAAELSSRGDLVHVWAPTTTLANGFEVHNTGGFGLAQLWSLDRSLNRFATRHVLVQWVPHGYGLRALNIFFCLWLCIRSRVLGDEVELMVHEPFLPFRKGQWKQNIAATIQRVMSLLVLASANRIWVSIPAWADLLRPYLLGRKIDMRWLPIPSTIPMTNLGGTKAQQRIATIGHFSTFGSASRMLETLLEPMLISGDTKLLLIGGASCDFARDLSLRFPHLSERIEATGPLPSEEVSRNISRCDLMVQTYDAGVCGRRTSAMAALSHGVPLVTTSGSATEEVWERSNAVVLIPTAEIEQLPNLVHKLLQDPDRRRFLGHAGRRFYDETFDLRHTVGTLREARMAA